MFSFYVVLVVNKFVTDGKIGELNK